MPEHAIELGWRFLLTLAPDSRRKRDRGFPIEDGELDAEKVRLARVDCRAVRALRAVLLSIIKANPAAGRSDRDRLALAMLTLSGDIT